MRGDVRSVLMTADAVGGVWTYAVDLCAELAARGLRTTLALMGPAPSAAQRADVLSIPGLSLAHAPWKLEWMDDPWADVDGASAWLLGLERQTRPDVIHLNGYAHGCVPFFAPVVVAGHSCVLSWFDQVKGTAPPSAYDEYRRRVARGLQCASAVVAPSAVMLGWLQRFHGPLRCCRMIHNAGRPDRPPPALKEPFVLGAGRMWDEAKNLEALCAAAARVSWPVMVAGDARGADGAVRQAQGIELLGPLPNKALLGMMARASIFAAPALYEPFGLSVLEAAGAGCALVLGDIPSFRELWEGCADFVNPRDPGSLAAALRSLIADPLRRAAFASRARARAGQFSAARMADGYLDTYRGAGLEPRGTAA